MTKEDDPIKLTLDGGGMKLIRTVSEVVAQQIVALAMGGVVTAAPSTAHGGGGFVLGGAFGGSGAT